MLVTALSVAKWPADSGEMVVQAKLIVATLIILMI